MMSINVIMTSFEKVFVVVLLVACFDRVLCEGKTCDVHILFECEPNEMCAQTDNGTAEGICICRTGFQLNENMSCTLIPELEHPNISSSEAPFIRTDEKYSGATASTITAGVLIPLSVLVVSGLMYVAHRYKWLQRLQQFRMRRYDEVHIGQDDDDDDDPPLQ
ncbi:uncharacterized protein LOC126183456 [Schistocerca cancellata]|uniref:uncharacterized protein LOC126183456 n=1 Tax=Schistocerca cancellata TaxID=274614 RepID=UPI00211805DF|nr:uncharacterized protein LOC126183456 [Schistocerca cancellata]